MQNVLPPLLAFGFGNLAMLGWLAAAAAPFLIHLWNRQQHREEPWAAVSFLLAAMRKNSRRIRIQNWLLLLLRTLIIVLVVLAVAEPQLERLGLVQSAGERTFKLFVLDGSYSMNFRSAQTTRFEKAERLIEQIVSESNQGDGFSLLLMGEPPQAIVNRPAFSRKDFLAELKGVSLPHANANLSATMKSIEAIQNEVAKKNPALVQKEIYFLTDLGKSTWAPRASNDVTEVMPKSLGQLTENAAVTVIDLGEETQQNLAVTQLVTRTPYAVVNRDLVIDVGVRNYGTQAKIKCVVQLQEDGTPLEDRVIDVPAESEVSVSFLHRFSESGEHVLRATISEDALELDDSRSLSLTAKSHLKVLCVEGRRNAARYVYDALSPTETPGDLVQAVLVSEGALSERNLEEFDAIFLCNIRSFTKSEVALLQAYLVRGGGLVLCLGDLVDSNNYNEVFGQASSNLFERFGSSEGFEETKKGRGVNALIGSIPLVPVVLSEVVPESTYTFDPLKFRHPIVAPFRGQLDAGLISTPVHRYIKMQVAEASADAQIAIAFRNGDPAIVVAPAFAGNIVVCSTAVSLSSGGANPWTEFPVWPSFVPLVRGMLNASLAGEHKKNNILVGEVLGGLEPSGSPMSALTLKTPKGTTSIVRPRSTLNGVVWSYDATTQSGVYEVSRAGNAVSPKRYAVNLKLTDSDLTKLATSALPTSWRIVKTWNPSREAIPTSIVRKSGLQRYLLLIAFIAILFELFLASWMRRNA